MEYIPITDDTKVTVRSGRLLRLERQLSEALACILKLDQQDQLVQDAIPAEFEGSEETLGKMVEIIVAQRDEARVDKERLEFYQRNPTRIRFVSPFWYSMGVSGTGVAQGPTGRWHSFREAIDAARKNTK